MGKTLIMKTPIKHGRTTSGNVKSFGLIKDEDKVISMKPRTSGLPYMVQNKTNPIKRLKRTYYSPNIKNS